MSGTADIAELLQHSSWIRRLARSLVRDDAAADDLVQETWMAALRSPPRAGETVRPWLAEVLRNLLRARFRSDIRRTRREDATVDKDVTAAATDQLVEAMQLQRELAEQVLDLDEPYRSTVLLRFYEGLSAAEIAARLQVPPGTVRWRLKTALDQLRTRLDRKHAGGRAAWLQALAPFVPEKLGRAAAPKGASVSTLKGAMTMKIGAAAVLTAGALGALVVFKPTTRAQPPRPETIAAPAPAPSSPAATRPGSPLPAAGSSLTRERLDAHTRAELLRRIAEARRSVNAGAVNAAELPDLDKDYIRERVKELVPLVKECYENALRTDSTLSGKLVVTFSIVGDPTVGGLVGDSAIDDQKSTIANKAMRECVRETMYAAKFQAPKESGEVRVEYPFVFKSSPQP
jgi:RNA polymerase sigma-70 factor (ECF subfamily)